MIRYKVTLTKQEREELKAIISKGKHTSMKYRNAYILINVDKNAPESEGGTSTNEQICKVLKTSMRTIDRVKKRFIEDGFKHALQRKPSQRIYEKKVDGELEARLIALSCSEPPEGYCRWSLRLLADKAVELNYFESISRETLRQVLKKK